MGTEPEHEQLLVFRQVRASHCHIKEQREEQHPEEHAHIALHPGKRRNDQREEGTIVVHVVVLLRIMVEERQLGDGMIPHANKDTVVAVAVIRLRDGKNQTHHHPHHQDGSVVVEKRVSQPLGHLVTAKGDIPVHEAKVSLALLFTLSTKSA